MDKMPFQERAFLTVFKRFFGFNYDAGSKTTTDLHVQSQKMCYILKAKGIEIGEFDYSWNFHGPYSAGLQHQLKILDGKKDRVCAYYELTESSTDLFSDDAIPNSVFSIADGDLIDSVSKELDIAGHKNDSRDWIELLASIMFISRSVFPGESRKVIENKLLELIKNWELYILFIQEGKILST